MESFFLFLQLRKKAVFSSNFLWEETVLELNLPSCLPFIKVLLLVFFWEKEMATHSSILVWRNLWTEEPCGLLSKGSRRVGQD